MMLTDEYIKKFTSSWFLVKDTARAELWSYFDGVEWKHKYAIAVDGRHVVLEEGDGNPETIFRIVSECI